MLLFLLIALGFGSEWSGQPPSGAPDRGAETQHRAPETLEDWLHDLESPRASDRLLAARELRRRALAARRKVERHRSEFAQLEAEVQLRELQTLGLAPLRRALAAHPRLSAPLADTARALALCDLRGDLEAALPRTEGERARARVREALTALERGPCASSD